VRRLLTRGRPRDQSHALAVDQGRMIDVTRSFRTARDLDPRIRTRDLGLVHAPGISPSSTPLKDLVTCTERSENNDNVQRTW